MEINYRARYISSAGQEIDKKLTDKLVNQFVFFQLSFDLFLLISCTMITLRCHVISSMRLIYFFFQSKDFVSAVF